MAEQLKLNHPWLVAVWPGMGHVALNAGIYLLARLNMTAVAEVETPDLFDVNEVEVKGGLIQPVRRPRNRFFVWKDPNGKHDLVVFLGEAQPGVGRFAFCRQVIGFAKNLGVERVFTFAAMATRMRPGDRSRVYGASTDKEGVDEQRRLELDVLEDGNIGGLNGVLLAAAAEAGLRGSCLLGEMPHVFAQAPYPKASLGILEVFTTLTGIELDLTELAEQAKAVEEQLGEILARVEEQYGPQGEAEPGGEADEDDEDDDDEDDDEEGSEFGPAAATPQHEGYWTNTPDEEPTPAGKAKDVEHVEELFRRAAADRSKAFELKRELDRLGLFGQYEDRFLDLFKKKE